MSDLENSGLFGTEFTPFNDTNLPRIEQAIISINVTTGGIDTSIVDPYREGVNIRTSKQRFISTQPKMWAGNLNHYTNTTVIGQARSFVEYENSLLFIDQPISASNASHPADFNPIQYIQDTNYPFPIKLNGGPQKEEEAYIEPLDIKFRKPSILGTITPNSIKANLEDGNYFDDDKNGANHIEQFISFTLPTQIRFFLDEGQIYYGPVLSGSTSEINEALVNSITVEGFVPIIQREIIPFNETKDEEIVDRISTTNTDLISVLKSLKFDLDNDIRENFNQKSSTAGYDVYGLNTGYTGTDSIAYVGTYRGSN